MRRLLAAVVLLASACSLPTPSGVKTVRQVDPGVQQPGGVRVFPPRPQPGQSPTEVVEGFLRAQASSDDNHAIARAFLTAAESAAWDDSAEVQVYAPNSLVVTTSGDPDDKQLMTATVRTTITGEVGRDGRYVGAHRQVTERYSLLRTAQGWRLQDVPDGLRLTGADLLRAYQPHDVYYVALSPSTDGQPRVVPDRVFLPLEEDLPARLVRRALRPPSGALSGSVSSAVPQGVELRMKQLRRSADGVLTVDLAGPLNGFSPLQLQELSARLVWTLRGDPGFRGLRLLNEGEPVRIPGAGAVQDAGSWEAFDPEGLGLDPAYFFVDAKRRLRSSLATLVSSPLTTPSAADGIGVDEVAVTTNPAQVAVYDARRRELHVGALTGKAYPTVAVAGGLSSLTWGSGAFGVWMLQRGVGIVRAVDLERRAPLRPVTVLGQLPGALTALAVSRDGTRAAVVAGGRLLVAKVDVVNGEPRLIEPTELLPGRLRSATRVAWATPTELVVIGTLGTPGVLRVPVDGSTSTVVQTGSLSPVELAAAGERLLVQSRSATGQDALYTIGPAVTRVAAGAHPAYPG